ncbi:MAG: MFS transporter, partial [Clostridia bacterium]
MSNAIEKVKTTKLGAKIWLCALFFGLIGQLAWIVENMYFAKFMQDVFTRDPWATTLMVALSALFATIATIITGALCDKTGKRKLFISIGYIIWGFTIMVFALIPINYMPEQKGGLIAFIIIMDCIMSYVGSSSNDAAFNTWVTDVTDTTNRAKLNTVLSMMPVFAMVIVFVGLDSLTSPGSKTWWEFFVILGAIPIVAGIIGLFVLKDAKNIQKNTNPNFSKELVYGFRPSVIKNNKMLYICLCGSAIGSASMQIYMSYLINFVTDTLKIENYILPLAIIIVLAAVIAGIFGFLMDKFGKAKFYLPVIIMSIVGPLAIYLLKFFGSAALMPVLIIGGVVLMGASLAMGGLFVAAFQDYIPKGKEGCFQGVRMFMWVLIPMLIGPLIAQLIIKLSGTYVPVEVSPAFPDGLKLVYPYELFLGAAVVAAFTLIPAYFVAKNDKKIRAKLIGERDAALALNVAENAVL